MFSCAVLTAAPVEVAPWPVLASALVAWLRAASAAICAAVLDVLVLAGLAAAWIVDFAVFADTVPASILVAWVPLTAPPAVLTKIWFSVVGLCQYCGATSITT